MTEKNKLYSSFQNPYLIQPGYPMPDEVAVIGAGNIGPDIAYYLRAGLPDKKLFLVDVATEQLEKAEKRFQGYALKGVERNSFSREHADLILNNIVYTTDYNQIKNCKLVIEAATENIDLKKKIFAVLEDIVAADAVLTSNTSSIPADQVFAGMKHPQRSTITHFFAPAWRSLVVEVIKWDTLDNTVFDYLNWFFANTGKVPIVTDNVIAFLLNRIFESWTNEAAFLVDKATAVQVDAVAEQFVGAGPFFVLNMAGGNPLTYASQTRRSAERSCYKPSPVLLSVDKWKTAKPGTGIPMPPDIKEWIRDRLIGAVFSQSFDIVDRNIGTASDLNLGSIIGLGFKKGIFDVMAEFGEDEVKRIMAAFDKERPGFPQPKGPIAGYLKFNRDILVDDKDRVRIITIRRPQAANALGLDTCSEILKELEKGVDDPSIEGFIITGYGTRSFCAGADISGFIATFDNHAAGVALAKRNSEVLHYIDKMEKPVVAALNGFAMGGGVELAIRCHSMVADSKAFFQLPEITLGILPGMGGAVIPYRKWPKAASIFHDMIGQAKKLPVQDAKDIGMVKDITDSYPVMMEAAIAEVHRLKGNIPRISSKSVLIAPFIVPDQPAAGKLSLSKEALGIVARVINDAAVVDDLYEALEINYQGSGDIACIQASKEGVNAFLQKRKAEFTR
ncbi:MAG: 3-hydroxyacyl-CoA dehydrogenase/enoyl-CoA hydratase family protein [Pseudomonadota bacterium]